MSEYNPSKPKPLFPYKGVRRSWYVFHPALHGPSYVEGLWENTVTKNFHQLLNDFAAVAEMYSEHESMHEKVGGDKWKKDVMLMYNSIAREDKDVYQLEALAEVVFDRDNKVEQRILPTHDEIRRRSTELRAEDMGLSLDGSPVNPNTLIKRGWAS